MLTYSWSERKEQEMRILTSGYSPVFCAGLKKTSASKAGNERKKQDKLPFTGTFYGLSGEKLLTYGLIATLLCFSLHLTRRLSSSGKQFEKHAKTLKKPSQNTDKLYGTATLGASGGAAGFGNEVKKRIKNDSSSTDEDKSKVSEQKTFDNNADDIHSLLELNGRDKTLSPKARAVADKFDEITERYMSPPEKDIFPLKKGDSIWAITAEYPPIQTGKQGEVPAALQKNFNKLGMNTFAFVPMYITTEKNDNRGVFKTSGLKTSYIYGKNKFEVKKIAEFKLPTEDGGNKKHDENVEFFIAKKKDGKNVNEPLIFVKNNYFKGKSIYSGTFEHPEVVKFAFFSKAMYELMKATVSPEDVKTLKIFDKKEFNKLTPPQGLILNGRYTAPTAAAVRYKSRLENADGKFSYDKKALKSNGSDKLYFPDIKIITTGNNSANGDIITDKKNIEYTLNTMFDEYADTVVNKIKIIHDEIVGTKNDDDFISVIVPSLKNIKLNMFNFGLIASDYFCPASKNYTEKSINNPDGKILSPVIRQKIEAGRVINIINGHDKALKPYFNNKNQYANIVKNCLDEDFDWILPGKKGPAFEYLQLFGVNISDLKDPTKEKYK